MKNFIFPAVAIVFSISANAQKPVFIQAKIESARVYANGAELKHKTTAQISSGTSEIVITNVANSLNESTIQIGVPKNVTVMSVQFSNAYLEEYDNNQNSPLLKPVRDSIKLVESDIKKLQNTRYTEQKAIELLDKNQQISSSQNFSVLELTKMVDYYKTKRTELSNSVDALEKKETLLIEKHQALTGRLQFNENKVESVSNGKLIVNVMSNQAGNIPLEISYVTDQAYWQPSYELRIDKMNEPIQLLYKAQVMQDCGIDWKNVKLSLTSGEANQNTFAPDLNTWFLNYKTGNARMNRMAPKAMVQGVSSQDKAVNSEMMADYNMVQNEVAGISTMDAYTQMNESQLNLSFDIDVPYTILSNGKHHAVALKEIKVPAEYSYVAIPKLDLNAYLIAKIKNYGDYNILPGEANVIFEDIYVGKTYITPDANEDDLKLSLGKDQNIAITRSLINDKSGTKTLSSRKVQDFVYEISVRNNKKQNVELVLEDQIPISSNSDIEIVLTDKGNGELNTENGKISWSVNLKTNETKKIRFGYQIKSAKDKTLRL